jgi:hypothetical protein
MKKAVFVLVAGLMSIVGSLKSQVIFTQDFSSSTTVTSYISTTPDSGQWNAIGSSGAGVTVTATSNSLGFSRAGANSGSFSRTTDFNPIPTALAYQFTLSISGNSTAATSAAVFQIGSGFGTANSTESNANTYARFGINLGATAGDFGIRDITNSTSSALFSGTQTLYWVLNNSGASLSYTDPSAGTTSLANDTADLWLGTTKVLNAVNIETASQTMTDLKFVFSGGSASIALDNFTITSIPEASTYVLVGLGLSIIALFRRRFVTSPS